VNAIVMKDSFAFGMDLVADVARNPTFAPEEIERQLERQVSSLRVSDEDPDYVASVLFDRLVYGFHPYGLPGSGTPESLAGITQDDLRAFSPKVFRAEQHDPRDRRRRDERGRVCHRRACVREMGARGRAGVEADRSAAADATPRHRR
jgi:hypothetical protein